MTKETITFEHLASKASGYTADVPDGYDGFHWDNATAVNTNDRSLPHDSGYRAALSSGNSIVTNGGGNDLGMSADTEFTLRSVHAAASAHGERVTFFAVKGGEEVGERTFHLGVAHGRELHLGQDFKNVDGIVVDTGEQDGTQVGLDDVHVRFAGHVPGAAPEPDPSAHPADATADHVLAHVAETWMLC